MKHVIARSLNREPEAAVSVLKTTVNLLCTTHCEHPDVEGDEYDEAFLEDIAASG